MSNVLFPLKVRDSESTAYIINERLCSDERITSETDLEVRQTPA